MNTDTPKFSESGTFRDSFLPGLISIAFHALFIIGLLQFSKTFYRSLEFDRPQTFELIKLTAAVESAVKSPSKPAQRPKAVAPPPVQQPVPAPPQDQTPVPAKEEAPPAPVIAEATAPSSQTGAVSATATPVEQADPNKIYDERNVDERATVSKRPEPFYPEFVQEQGIQGIVRAQVIIDKDGLVSSVHILKSPHELLSEEFTKALTRYRFKPAKVKGKPVIQKGIIEFEFRL
jgi:TonB family protein